MDSTIAATTGTNVALASAGAVATASSTYGSGFLPATVIDGERSGTAWGTNGGWADGTPGTFPDWIEVDFPTSYAISQVHVFSVQDNYASPVEPTPTQTFTLYGVRDFQVQYWTGTAWVTVPGATITGNNLVWRAITFSPVTTQKIRVLVTAAADDHSRLTELEAYTPSTTPPPPPTDGTNVALASAGAVATASSTYGRGFLPATAIDGERAGTGWGTNGGWADATPGSFPDWIEVDFPGSYAIRQVNVFSVQDNWATPVEPTPTQTFTLYGLRDFQVQYWTGAAWAAIPGATITGNNLVWKAISFSPVTTQKIRVLITNGGDDHSRLTELEVYATGPTPPPPPNGTNVALASAGAVATASSIFGSGFLPATVIDGERSGTGWGTNGGWADGTPGTFPDWIEVDFPTSYAIGQVHVFSVQDNYASPVEPTPTQTFTLYGVRDFQVQYWTGTAWAAIPGATITGNNLVWKAISFSPVTTQKIRVLITNGAGGHSRLTELEAYTTTPNAGSDSLNNRVLVVYNSAMPDSLAVADYYMQKRNIPAGNRCSIYKTGDLEFFESIEEYKAIERDPLRACLAALGPEKILYIVFSYGTPFKITGRSTDQLVADIWDLQPPDPDEGFAANPYYAESASLDNVYPHGVSFAEFRSSSPLVYSVWRLDAPTPALARGLVDQALQVEALGGLNGRGCFDGRSGDITIYPDIGYVSGDWDIFRASQMFANAGFDVVLDTNPEEFGTPPAPPRCENAAFYTGWYQLGHYNDVFSWNPGAIGWHLDSLSATSPRTSDNWAGGALGRGIAVTTGAVDEPYLEGLPHSDGVLRNLLEGLNVGDAIFRNTQWIRWMVINIGDPLYRPFPGGRP